MYVPAKVFTDICRWYGKPFPCTTSMLTKLNLCAQVEASACEDALSSVDDTVSICYINQLLTKLHTAKHIQHIIQPYI